LNWGTESLVQSESSSTTLQIITSTVTDIPVQATEELGRLEVKVKVKYTLEQATKIQRGSRGMALLFL
jgi:hypothetical protein